MTRECTSWSHRYRFPDYALPPQYVTPISRSSVSETTNRILPLCRRLPQQIGDCRHMWTTNRREEREGWARVVAWKTLLERMHCRKYPSIKCLLKRMTEKPSHFTLDTALRTYPHKWKTTATISDGNSVHQVVTSPIGNSLPDRTTRPGE
ncbi:hypothetical protein B296_00041482 [Ensete ventricosum]|uniref:Uncharacterized protein n=1 Tax=Ensete ventricosum TaxID=4639 RepID=A0A426Z0Y9_ENSVE|nr:hypothetical protein B296_00041482 [Ensete ventricosum]